jgi:hypothetical protein
VDTKKDLHEESVDLRIQGTQVEIEMRTPVGTPQCEFNMQVPEVRALATCISCGRTGTSV